MGLRFFETTAKKYQWNWDSFQTHQQVTQKLQFQYQMHREEVQLVLVTGSQKPTPTINLPDSGSREKKIENVFFEPVWRRKLFQMKVWVAAINSIKFSSKSELTSRFFSRLKFRFFFETSNGRLPLEISSDRLQTWPKRVSDDPRRFIFRRQKQIFGEIFGSKFHLFCYFGQVLCVHNTHVRCVYTQHICVLCVYTTHMCAVYIHDTHVCCV